MKKTMMIISVILIVAIAIIGITSIIKLREEGPRMDVDHLKEFGFVQSEDNPNLWHTVEGVHWDRYEVHAVYNSRTNRGIVYEFDPATGAETERSVIGMGDWFLILEEFK